MISIDDVRRLVDEAEARLSQRIDVIGKQILELAKADNDAQKQRLAQLSEATGTALQAVKEEANRYVNAQNRIDEQQNARAQEFEARQRQRDAEQDAQAQKVAQLQDARDAAQEADLQSYKDHVQKESEALEDRLSSQLQVLKAQVYTDLANLQAATPLPTGSYTSDGRHDSRPPDGRHFKQSIVSFSGKPKGLPVQSFIEIVDTAVRLHKLEDQDEMVASYVRSMLSDLASIATTGEMTWTAMKSALMSAFYRPGERNEATQRLHHMRAWEYTSWDDFRAAYMSDKLKAKPIDDALLNFNLLEALRGVFPSPVSHLESQIQMWEQTNEGLKYPNTNLLTQLNTYVGKDWSARCQVYLAQNPQDQVSAPPTGTRRNNNNTRPPPTLVAPPVFPAHTPVTPGMDVDALANLVTDRLRARTVKCHYCGIVGHVFRKCFALERDRASNSIKPGWDDKLGKYAAGFGPSSSAR